MIVDSNLFFRYLSHEEQICLCRSVYRPLSLFSIFDTQTDGTNQLLVWTVGAEQRVNVKADDSSGHVRFVLPLSTENVCMAVKNAGACTVTEEKNRHSVINHRGLWSSRTVQSKSSVMRSRTRLQRSPITWYTSSIPHLVISSQRMFRLWIIFRRTHVQILTVVKLATYRRLVVCVDIPTYDSYNGAYL